jgi:hypothetical protein
LAHDIPPGGKNEMGEKVPNIQHRDACFSNKNLFSWKIIDNPDIEGGI